MNKLFLVIAVASALALSACQSEEQDADEITIPPVAEIDMYEEDILPGQDEKDQTIVEPEMVEEERFVIPDDGDNNDEEIHPEQEGSVVEFFHPEEEIEIENTPPDPENILVPIPVVEGEDGLISDGVIMHVAQDD